MVLPWSQFLYAEGGDTEVHLTFATHEVVIWGAGLDELIEDLSAQRVSLVRESARTEYFGTGNNLRITSISVHKME